MRQLILGLLIGGLLGGAGCGKQAPPPSRTGPATGQAPGPSSSPGELEETVVVYSPHGVDLLGEMEERFEAAYPDVDVQWLDLGSQEVLERVRNEKANPQGGCLVGSALNDVHERRRGRVAGALSAHLGPGLPAGIQKP